MPGTIDVTLPLRETLRSQVAPNRSAGTLWLALLAKAPDPDGHHAVEVDWDGYARLPFVIDPHSRGNAEELVFAVPGQPPRWAGLYDADGQLRWFGPVCGVRGTRRFTHLRLKRAAARLGQARVGKLGARAPLSARF